MDRAIGGGKNSCFNFEPEPALKYIYLFTGIAFTAAKSFLLNYNIKLQQRWAGGKTLTQYMHLSWINVKGCESLSTFPLKPGETEKHH